MGNLKTVVEVDRSDPPNKLRVWHRRGERLSWVHAIGVPLDDPKCDCKREAPPEEGQSR